MPRYLHAEADPARAWPAAAELARHWPDVVISWADWYTGPAHLVVGTPSAQLHFAHPDGPTFEASGEEVTLTWDEVERIDAANPFIAFPWSAHWGEPTAGDHPSAKCVVYDLIAALLHNPGPWTARAARVVFATADPLDDPDAVFGLLDAFPSLMSTVQWYASQVGLSVRRSRAVLPEGWHEPLWLVSRDELPIAVLDEAGRVHLPRVASGDDNRADLLELVADEADWEAGGFSFDVLAAATQAGSVAELAALITPGTRRAFGLRRAWNPSDPSRERVEPRRLQD